MEQLEKHMVMCINTKTGRRKPFPIKSTESVSFPDTGWKVYDGPAAPYIKQTVKAQTEIDKSNPKAKENFEKFVNTQKDLKVLEQSKTKFKEDWQISMIESRIVELTPEVK